MPPRRSKRRRRAHSPPPREEVVLVQVLCVRDDGAVLLRQNDDSAGPSLAGLWAGLLGAVLDGETLEDASRRLASPLVLSSLRRAAVFEFTEDDDPVIAHEHEFIAMNPSGPLPDGCQWVPRAQLDFASMPADDAHWYGRVLDGELLVGFFDFFGASTRPNRLRCHNVRALNTLIDEPSIDEELEEGEQRYTRVAIPNGLDGCEVRYVD